MKCWGGQAVYEYIIAWLAFMFQRPEMRTEILLFFQGDEVTPLTPIGCFDLVLVWILCHPLRFVTWLGAGRR
jgi:hypothetical protein